MSTLLITGFTSANPFRRSGSKKINNPQKIIAKAIVDRPDNYDCKKGEGEFTWTLKSTVKKKYLTNFLKRYYHDFYGKDSSFYIENCQPVIDFLSTNPSNEKLEEWEEDQCNNAFGLDDNYYEEITVEGKEMNVFISCYRLSFEGKVEYEELDEHMKFFKKLLRKVYADNPLGGCLIVEVG